MTRRDFMKSYHEQAVRKYLILCTILGCALVLIWLISCIWVHGLAAILLLLIMLIVSKVTISIVAKKTLLSVLYVKLDAIEFQKIVNDSRFKVPLIYRISSAISSGDYQTVVNIATKSLLDKKANIKVKYYYLSVLARAYFELRDFEKLKVLLAKYEEYKTNYPSKSFLNSSKSVWSYYQYFFEQNYKACKIICKERTLGLRPNAWNAQLGKLQNDFLYAIACYENTEIDEAKQVFSSIMQKAPNLYLHTISKKYIEAIQGGQLYFEEILPDNNYRFVGNKKLKVVIYQYHLNSTDKQEYIYKSFSITNETIFSDTVYALDKEDDPAERIDIPFINPVTMYRNYDLKADLDTSANNSSETSSNPSPVACAKTTIIGLYVEDANCCLA